MVDCKITLGSSTPNSHQRGGTKLDNSYVPFGGRQPDKQLRSLGRPFNAWFLLLCLPADSEHGQRLPDVEVAQQLKLRERQRFFEEVFQHDVDVYLSSAHLCIHDYKRRELEVHRFNEEIITLYACILYHNASNLLQLQSAASRPWK